MRAHSLRPVLRDLRLRVAERAEQQDGKQENQHSEGHDCCIHKGTLPGEL
jgi:hypothetical protein